MEDEAPSQFEGHALRQDMPTPTLYQRCPVSPPLIVAWESIHWDHLCTYIPSVRPLYNPTYVCGSSCRYQSDSPLQIPNRWPRRSPWIDAFGLSSCSQASATSLPRAFDNTHSQPATCPGPATGRVANGQELTQTEFESLPLNYLSEFVPSRGCSPAIGGAQRQ